MSKLSTAYSLLKHNRGLLFATLLQRIAFLIPSDKLYLKLLFRLKKGRSLCLSAPHTFCEKIQWLKLYYRKPEFITMVDKATAKAYVAERVGEEYIIPTYGVWDRSEDIDWDALPNEFVLKPTNGGGGSSIVVCTDKAKLNKAKVMQRLKEGLKQDIYTELREWPYKNVKPRVMAEKYIAPPTGDHEQTDYKFYCFGGKPTYCQIIKDRTVKKTIDFYDMEWHLMPFSGLSLDAKRSAEPCTKPQNLNTMIGIARTLSQGHPFLRIDLYNIEGKIYFGELTLYPASGLGKFTPFEWDEKVGEMIVLPELN